MTTIYSFGEFDETPKTPTRKNTSKARWVQDENTLNAPFRGEPSESQVQSLKSQSMVSTTFPNMIEDSYSHMEDLIDVEATHTLDMRSTTTALDAFREDYESKIEQIQDQYSQVLSQNEILLDSIESLKAKIADLESEVKVEEIVDSMSKKEELPLKSQSLESLLNTLFPYLSMENIEYISQNISHGSRFSRSVLRKFWASVLILDFAYMFIQSRWPQLFHRFKFTHWNNRLTTLRYCVEMVLVVQFGTAIHEFFNSPNSDWIYKGIYDITTSLKYGVRKAMGLLPTTLLFGSVIMIGSLLFKARVLGQQMDWQHVVKRLNVQ